MPRSTKSKRHMELVGGMGHWMFSLSDSRNGNGFRADFDLFITSILFFPAGREVGGGGGLQPRTSDVFAEHTLLLWMARVSSGECENR